MWGLLNSMFIFIYKLVMGSGRKRIQRAQKTETEILEKRRLYGLYFGTGHYLPRRVTVSTLVRWFGGHWNPVCEYLHWITGAEGRLWGRQEPLVTTVWKWCPHAVYSSAASSPVWPSLCFLRCGYEIAANTKWCVERVSSCRNRAACLLYSYSFFFSCVYICPAPEKLTFRDLSL